MQEKGKIVYNDSLLDALRKRRSIRKFKKNIMDNESFEKILWASYGNTHNKGSIKFRTAPSAGATYPIDLYVVTDYVDGYENAVYIFDKSSEQIKIHKTGVFSASIQRGSYNQTFITESNIIFVLAYDPNKIVGEYGLKSRDYALLECGHVAQNILLMATALNLGAVVVGAFEHDRVKKVLEITKTQEILYMICIGMI